MLDHPARPRVRKRTTLVASAWRRWLAVGTTALLVVGGTTGTAVAETTDAVPTRTGVAPPPIVSPATHLDHELPKSASPDTSGTRTSDAPRGNSQPPTEVAATVDGYNPLTSVEVVGERDAFAKIYDNVDGTRTLIASAVPVHYRAGEDWVPIDTHVIPDATRPGWLRSKANAWTARFGPSTEGVTIETPTDAIRFAPAGANAVVPVVGPGGTSAVYANVWPGVDLRYDVRSDRVEESIVVRVPGAPSRYEFTVDRAYAADAATGGLTFAGPAGETWRVARPEVVNRPEASPVFDIDTDADGGTLALSVDAMWLATLPASELPIVIDPTYYSTGSNDSRGFVDPDDGTSCQPCQVRVGNYYREVQGNRYWQSFVHFPYNQLANSTILDSQVFLADNRGETLPHNIELWRASGLWFDGRDWNTGLLAEDVATTNAGLGSDALSDLLQAKVNANDFGTYFAFVGEQYDEEFTYQEWHTFELHVDYNRPPATPTLTAPAWGANLHTLTPTMSWSGSDPDNDALTYEVEVTEFNGTEEWWWSGSTPSVALGDGFGVWNQGYDWRVRAWDGFAYSAWSETRRFAIVNNAPPTPTLVSPAGTVAAPTMLTAGSPTLVAASVLDPDVWNGVRDRVQYQFEVAAGTDITRGQIAVSPWLDWGVTSWTPPTGTLQDGGVYTWRASTRDEWGYGIGSSPTGTFKIDFRLGAQPTLPFDDLGPVDVNLATGNVVVSAGGPSYPTVGGPVGVSFTYNAQAPKTYGLTGDYYQDLNHNGTWDTSSEPKLLRRTDSVFDINWGSNGPNDGPNPGVIAPEWWGAVWSGTFQPTATGSYAFISSATDDKVKVTLNGAVVLNATTPGQTLEGSSTTLLADSVNTIRIDYAQATGPEKIHLQMRGPDGTVSEIPSFFFFPTAPSLPDGWGRTGDFLGGGEYTTLRLRNGATAVAVDETGADHVFTAASGGGWVAPAGEDTVLTQRPDGQWNLLGEDGYLYRFDVDGRLIDVTSALDDVHPGAPTYTYGVVNTGGPLRMTRITDAAGRAVDLSYGGQSCPTAARFTAAPTNMLCKIAYAGFGGGTTELYYSNGHLARIVNPGGEITDFGYDTAGRLTAIRDALTNDLIAGGQIPAAEAGSDTHKTLIAYTSSGSKVASVTLPVPNATSARAAHSYDYTNGTQTKVFVAGLLTDPTKPARTVTLDSAGHATTDVDSAGITTTNTWDVPNDRLTKTTRAGLQTTYVYDAAGRLTDTYGPAPIGEFTGLTSTTAPRSSTAYDEGINGLAAAWHDNATLTGVPKAHTTSAVADDWTTGSPAAGIPADRFSGRLTGEVTLPTAGKLTVDSDGARVYVDDQLKLDTWGGPYRVAAMASNPGGGYYRLGETSGTTAADTYGVSPGTYGGNVTLGATGVLTNDDDKAATFGGTGYVTVPDHINQRNPATTIEAWIKTTSTQRGRIVAKPVVAGQSQAYALGVNVLAAGKAEFRTDRPAPGAVVTSTTTVTDGNWHHLVGRHSGSSISFFVDGVLQGTASTGSQSWLTYDNALPLNIGRFDNVAGEYFNGTIDEVAIYPVGLGDSDIVAHYNARSQATVSKQTPTLTAGTHRLRVDYQELIGTAKLAVTGPVGTVFKPRYNLPTTTTDADGKVRRTEYARPELGLSTATVADPAGLNLRSTISYEPAGSGAFYRRTARTLPKGAATTIGYTYYGISETPSVAAAPCSGTTGVSQAGALKTSAEADPDGAGPQTAIVREYRYDALGRVIASRVQGDSAWACTTYDTRGRVTSSRDRTGKTLTNDYSVPGRVTTAYVDSGGTTRTTVSRVDWTGRASSYTDEHGTLSETVYDQAGRTTATYRTFAGQARTQLTSNGYDGATGRLSSSTEYLSGSAKTTTFGYDATNGALKTTTRPNGVVTTNTFTPTRGWLTDISHKLGANELSPWHYDRNPSGDVSLETTTLPAGGPSRTRTFSYDGAGRLSQTVEGATTRRYLYDANSNRCLVTSSPTATCASATYTYDNADRLLTSPFASSHVYDSHGNLTSAALTGTTPPPGSLNQTYSFDSLASAPFSTSFVAGQAGTITAQATPSATPTVRSGSPTGSLAPSGTWSTTAPAYGQSYLAAAVTWTASSGGMAPVTARWKDAAGTIVATASSSTGSLSIGYLTPSAGGTYTLHLTDDSTSRNVPSFTAAWSSTTAGTVPLSGSLAAMATSAPVSVVADGAGRIHADLTYTEGSRPVTTSQSQNLTSGGVADQWLHRAAPGPMSLSVNWAASRTSLRQTGAAPGAAPEPTVVDYPIQVGASGSVDLALSWPATTPELDASLVALALVDASGAEVARTDSTPGGPTSLALHHNVTGVTYPTRQSFTVRVINKGPLATTFDLSGSYPVWANVDLDLYNPAGTIVASSSSTTARPEVLTYTVPSGGGGNYRLRARSADYAAGITGTASFTQWNPAYVTARLKNAAGAVVATTSTLSGTVALDYDAPGAGTYTFELVNGSSDTAVPSYTGTIARPQQRASTVGLVLKDAAGAVVATGTGTTPVSLSASVAAGRYTLESSALSGTGTATLTGSYPGRLLREVIGYDGNDHATSIDDGTNLTSETLNPDGRVVRRVVSDSVSGDVSEDVSYGYDGPGDSPAYVRAANGTVTTYLPGPDGLLAVYTGTVAAYPLANAHGDIAATTDAAGAVTALPATDEFGITASAPAGRLGWLGAKERFATGGALKLIRMGVRLYDPALGRFLQVDPIEGASANAYDYVFGDPVNSFDLDGRRCWSPRCAAKAAGRFVKRHRHTLINIAIGAAGAAIAGACVGTVVCGLALGGAALAGAGAHMASDRIGKRDGRALSFRNALGQSTISAFSGGLCGKLVGVGCGRGAFAPSALRKTSVDRVPLALLWLYSNALPKLAFRP